MKKLLMLSLLALGSLPLCAMENNKPIKKRKMSVSQTNSSKKTKLDALAQVALDKELLDAVQNSSTTVDQLKALIKKGANPNSKIICEENEFTILVNAIFTLSCEHIKLLIDNGADVNQKSEIYNTTPLHFAIMDGNEKCIELLISEGANIHAKQSPAGDTALHSAIQYHRNNLACQLITQYGANIDALDIHGNTPLHYAAQENNLAGTHILFEYGAVLELKNNDNNTPLDEAAQYNNYQVVDLLEDCISGDIIFNIKSNKEPFIYAIDCLYRRLKESVYFQKLQKILTEIKEDQNTQKLAKIITQLNNLHDKDDDEQRRALCKAVIQNFNKQKELQNEQQTRTLNLRITSGCAREYLLISKFYTIDRYYK